jgi:hypothetical protein
MRTVLFVAMALLLITSATAQFGYDNPALPRITPEEPTVITFNNNTGAVNTSIFADIWLTAEGNMDDISDLYSTLNGQYIRRDGASNATEKIGFPKGLTIGDGAFLTFVNSTIWQMRYANKQLFLTAVALEPISLLIESPDMSSLATNKPAGNATFKAGDGRSGAAQPANASGHTIIGGQRGGNDIFVGRGGDGLATHIIGGRAGTGTPVGTESPVFIGECTSSHSPSTDDKDALVVCDDVEMNANVFIDTLSDGVMQISSSQITTGGNIDLGAGNLTTTGGGQFAYTDLLEITEPATPPADTLRLYAVEQDGFSRYNYKDEFGVSRTINDDEIIVNNSRGSTIAKHRLVYVSGYDAGVPTVDLAKADNLSTMPSICVTVEAISDGEYGRCIMTGLIQDVNTNAFDVGVIYVSDATAGIPTNTPPVTPNLTQEIGSILVKSATVGEIQVIARALTGDEFGTINDFAVVGNLTSDWATFNNLNVSGTSYLGDLVIEADNITVTNIINRSATTFMWGDVNTKNDLTVDEDLGVTGMASFGTSPAATNRLTVQLGTSDNAGIYIQGTTNTVAAKTTPLGVATTFTPNSEAKDFSGMLFAGVLGTTPNNISDFRIIELNPISASAYSGTIDDFYYIDASGLWISGSVDNAYGFLYHPNKVAGTWNNSYGIKLENIPAGTTSTYAIQTGTGAVEFGDTVNTTKHMNVAGNFTGNQYYAEMYIHNHPATTLTLTVQSQYENVTSWTFDSLNGFTNTTNYTLTANVAGLYKADYAISSAGSSNQNDEYSYIIAVDDVVKDNCHSHRNSGTSSAIGSVSGTCFVRLSVNDVVMFQIANEDTAPVQDIDISSANLNLLRIGD